MKTLLFIVILLLAVKSFSQISEESIPRDTVIKHIEDITKNCIWLQIAGNDSTRLYLNRPCSQEQIEKIFGKISSVFIDNGEDEPYGYHVGEYRYGKDLSFETLSHKLKSFRFKRPDIELHLKCWDMIIKIGDPIEPYQKLGKDKALLYFSQSSGTHIYMAIDSTEIEQHLELKFDDKRKITGISCYHYP